MPAAVLNYGSHNHSTAHFQPTAHLQIKYVSRLPDTRTSSPFFSSLRARSATFEAPMCTATVTENTQSQSWKITAIIRNATSQPQSQAIKIYSWPMFAPEDSQFIASAGTTAPVEPAQNGMIEIEVPKRDLAEWSERRGKWVLEEGIYMFEIKASEDLGAGTGIVKQVSVVGHMEWSE
ncbi:hypothetical protein OHC33_006812 [Knufia fluminis]|uniref:Fibronectin type III-like domain-containing protein n=1 Tax=Knufia fluminis TaxID=191047 RepID=A0AAN8I507_9EURO|nr:hypothetical protein OHC33_006812 [Knufia fluminis]